jgi:hypothetical protein
MRRVGLAAILLTVVIACPGSGHADALRLCDLYQRAQAWVQTLIGASPVDRDIIKPPASLDSQMALVPPPGGTMRLIVPPDRLRQE